MRAIAASLADMRVVATYLQTTTGRGDYIYLRVQENILSTADEACGQTKPQI